MTRAQMAIAIIGFLMPLWIALLGASTSALVHDPTAPPRPDRTPITTTHLPANR